MDTLALLRFQIRECYTWLEMTLSDITEEQANWQPPGIANPIGATYAHLMITADAGFNSQLHGGMPIMASEFRGKIGLSEMPHAAGGGAPAACGHVGLRPGGLEGARRLPPARDKPPEAARRGDRLPQGPPG